MKVRVLVHGSNDDADPVVRELTAAGFTPTLEVIDRVALHAELRASPSPTVVVRGTHSDAIAQLASSLGHELRNLLIAPLTMQLSLADHALVAGNLARSRALIAAMLEMVEHGDAAIERLQRFGSQIAGAQLARQIVHPDELAKRASEIARAHLRDGGDRTLLVLELGATAPIHVDAAEVVAALVNVIGNALDALAFGGGTITVRSGTATDGAWFEVIDDGPGIPPEARKRLFEPFFTTKTRGTGIGLAMVEACMRRHGGTVELATGAGTTTFRLQFPPS